MKPLLGSKDSDILWCRKFELHWNFSRFLESVLEIVEISAIQELRFNFHNRFAITEDFSLNLDHFPRIIVDDGGHLSGSRNNITSLEGSGAGSHSKTVGQVNEFEEIAVD